MIYDRVLTVCTLDTEAEPRCLRRAGDITSVNPPSA